MFLFIQVAAAADCSSTISDLGTRLEAARQSFQEMNIEAFDGTVYEVQQSLRWTSPTWSRA